MSTIDDSLSEIRSVRNDIWRCRKLLQTDLPDAEREIIEKRLLEQRSAFEGLLASTLERYLRDRWHAGESDPEELTCSGLSFLWRLEWDNW